MRPGRLERMATRAGVSLDELGPIEGKGKSGRRNRIELLKRIAVADRSPDDGTRVDNTWPTLDHFRPWRELYASKKRRKRRS
jgi:hypothetical protein